MTGLYVGIGGFLGRVVDLVSSHMGTSLLTLSVNMLFAFFFFALSDSGDLESPYPLLFFSFVVIAPLRAGLFSLIAFLDSVSLHMTRRWIE
jgi:hypothetical protein